jgi:aspartate kinase
MSGPPLIVHKFGGSSLGSPERVRSTADILTRRTALFPQAEQYAQAVPVVVVSALQGVTDGLIQAARAAAGGDLPASLQRLERLQLRHTQAAQVLLTAAAASASQDWIGGQFNQLRGLLEGIATLNELSARTRDRVVSFGELLAAQLLATLLAGEGFPAQAVSTAGLIVTDERFGGAKPLLEQTRLQTRAQLLPLIRSGIIPVVTGYIAATSNGIPTTLGRGGSDFSAAILGAGLDAQEVWIWSDVDGILTADPHLVPEAQTLPELSYQEAQMLAEYGAEVLHPKTIQPLFSQKIPLRLLNSFNPTDPGTIIVPQPTLGRSLPPAIITTSDLSLVTYHSEAAEDTLAWSAQILNSLHAASLDVPSFARSFAERQLYLIIRSQDQEHCLNTVRQSMDGAVHLDLKEQVATISIVSFAGDSASGFIGKALSSLGSSGARLIAVTQAASEHAISVCIPGEQLAETVRYLHHSLAVPIF